ncbi:hypothetical protein PGT21_037293 [Puccinia graminis f. sp. tritici]|uniref:MULE transposase domain-containing protein n=1 Tax=Puccinia graminis f. sp. tritici TaxID=56615 RepID=A0A5B0R4L8_PUCGR|nr:hypothetical protein PGT21_037293 [Puccinia graminis f. sp. tritici]
MAPATITPSAFGYPLVQDIYEVVPRPHTQEITAAVGVSSAPNSLRLVRNLGGASPTFPTHPYLFTIPGHSKSEAEEFVKAMTATVRWTLQRRTPSSTQKSTRSHGSGRHPEAYFKLEYQCPCSGFCKGTPNSRKKNHVSARCGCKARFSITHHIQSNTLRVTWHWQHNHNLNSHHQMLITRPPLVVDQWVKDRVDSGLAWKEIYDLTQVDDVWDLRSSTVKPEAHGVTYDRVRYLIQTRRTIPSQLNRDPLQSLSMWHVNLISRNWNTHVNIVDSSDFVFAFQSPWQKQMLIEHGRSMLMLDATHNTVNNYFLSNGKKVYLYTFLIRDPIVGKGLPIAWAFTASAAE